MLAKEFFVAVEQCLLISEPLQKVAAVNALYEQFSGSLWLSSDSSNLAITPSIEANANILAADGSDCPSYCSSDCPTGFPGRPERPKLVRPRDVERRSLHTEVGQAALVHAVCHIEFNAINLALDAAYRFRDMPAEFYGDWLTVAWDEARHFGWLSSRLQALGYAYGDFNAHNGLWEMAEKTAHDVLVRMALVPRVLEARGLDVTPAMIERLQKAGDQATVEILHNILQEEIPHVAVGTRWYRYCCEQRGLQADELFTELLYQYMRTPPGGPYNLSARYAAGFTPKEMQLLQARQSSSQPITN